MRSHRLSAICASGAYASSQPLRQWTICRQRQQTCAAALARTSSPARTTGLCPAPVEHLTQSRPLGTPQSELNVQIILSLLDMLPSVDLSGDGGKACALRENPSPADQAAEADVCTICLCGYEGDERMARLLPCTHSFHPDCIALWFSSGRSLDGACPICKQPMLPPDTEGGAGRGGRVGRCGGCHHESDATAGVSARAGGAMDVVVQRT
jgi:hypothetical protein